MQVNVQIYSGALYVEADKCSKELGIRARGGFFENDQDFMSAVMEGAFNKVLIVSGGSSQSRGGLSA
jgi:hypothetical protein